MLDPLMIADRLPKLGERAMRAAILTASARRRGAAGPGHRALVDDALLRFERLVGRLAPHGIRPALLFAERDAIVRELGIFLRSRLAVRLFAVHARDLIAIGRSAAPFDAIVRGRRGGAYGVVFRRLPRDGRRLESMRAIRSAALALGHRRLRGVLVYDLTLGSVRTLRCGASPVELSAA
jgi:hypothetical protein